MKRYPRMWDEAPADVAAAAHDDAAWPPA
jgi:hypothetical protein